MPACSRHTLTRHTPWREAGAHSALTNGPPGDCLASLFCKFHASLPHSIPWCRAMIYDSPKSMIGPRPWRPGNRTFHREALGQELTATPGSDGGSRRQDRRKMLRAPSVETISLTRTPTRVLFGAHFPLFYPCLIPSHLVHPTLAECVSPYERCPLCSQTRVHKTRPSVETSNRNSRVFHCNATSPSWASRTSSSSSPTTTRMSAARVLQGGTPPPSAWTGCRRRLADHPSTLPFGENSDIPSQATDLRESK